MLAVLAAGLVVGRLRGGHVRALSGVTLRAGGLLVVALTARVALGFGLAPETALVIGQVAPLGFAWANRALPGMPLVGVGAALNAVVMLANGAMPVAAPLADAPRHRPLAASDALPLLADIVPLPGATVSLGDLVLAVGVLALVPALMQDSVSRGSNRGLR